MVIMHSSYLILDIAAKRRNNYSMKIKAFIILSVFVCFALAAWLVPDERVFRASDGKKIPFDNMISDVRTGKDRFRRRGA